MQEGRGGEDLEIGGPDPAAAAAGGLAVHRLDHRPDVGQQVGELSGRTGPAVDGDPFFHAFQVRRGEQPGPIAGRGEDGGQGGRGRALSLGAGDVDGGQVDVRVAQSREQLPHATEAELGQPVGHHPHPLVVDAIQQKLPRGGVLFEAGHGTRGD